MTIAQGYKPHDMYHPTDAPRRIESADEKAKAEADGYGMTYVHQPLPTTLHKNGKTKKVETAAEVKTYEADGWSKDAPALDGGSEQ